MFLCFSRHVALCLLLCVLYFYFISFCKLLLHQIFNSSYECAIKDHSIQVCSGIFFFVCGSVSCCFLATRGRWLKLGKLKVTKKAADHPFSSSVGDSATVTFSNLTHSHSSPTQTTCKGWNSSQIFTLRFTWLWNLRDVTQLIRSIKGCFFCFFFSLIKMQEMKTPHRWLIAFDVL